jgi:uncharacterized NAD(P)/FAD-binding protein YdhS
MSRQAVAVVGGGCSGVLAARELLRMPGVQVLIIDPGELGGGVAYGAARPWHLLNSRAGAMSAEPEDPGHFARWAGVGPQEFVPRPVYARYLRSVLTEAFAVHPDRLRVIKGRAVTVRAATRAAAGDSGDVVVSFPTVDRMAGVALGGVVPVDGDGGRVGVVLADGRVIWADHVVLAVGNPAGGHPSSVPAEVREHPAYVGDPWRDGALEALPKDRPVLLIGTGLTAVDVALTLTSGERTAPVLAVSRRGLLPLAHTVTAAPPRKPALDDCAGLREVIRVVREAAGEAGDWRAIVDGLRPDLDRLWGALTPAEQDAFLRHLARPWECHRHRMAPAVASRVAWLRTRGLLRIRAGGLRTVTPAEDGGLVAGLASGPLAVGGIVNCAGPGLLPAAGGPLITRLLTDGVARVGPHGLGLDIDHFGRLVGAGARTQEGVWVLGPLRRGARWETTAVPEIRDQARRLAHDIAAQTAAPAVAA